jgi:pyruvate dehydrogenase E1 component alpha subunit
VRKIWSPESLVEFETKVAEKFNLGEIRAPIHLSDGTEEQLINIFRDVKDEDWVFCSWRSHYQCLLKGVPEEEVFKEIVNGNSITLAFPEYKVFSSAIVGGSLPIALGVALSQKFANSASKVWCFLGDMTSETGMAQTCFEYAKNHELPIIFVIEDNGISTVTETRQVWNSPKLRYENFSRKDILTYKYKSKYPHSGAGKRVEF